MKTIFDGREENVSDEEIEKARNEYLRKSMTKRLEGDLQLDGYILLGWHNGRPKEKYYCNWKRTNKYGSISQLGMAAYYPITGSRWVYVWNTHARYAPHPDPIWENKRWTRFVETDDKPRRVSSKKMLALLAEPKPPYDRPVPQNNVWMPSVPLWLLDNKQDMRPLYLAGGEAA